MSIRHGAISGRILGNPLSRARGAFGLLPFVTKQVVKILVIPFYWIGRPCTFQSTGDRILRVARAKTVLPSEPLLFKAGSFRLGTDVLVWVARTVRFAKGVSPRNKSDRLLIVHRHPAKGLANVPCRRQRVWISIGALRIYINETHLNGSKRVFEFPVTRVALVTQPFALDSPVHIDFRFPNVFAPARKTVRLQAHRLDRASAREYHQVRP